MVNKDDYYNNNAHHLLWLTCTVLVYRVLDYFVNKD